jgi:hypothetical protein
MTRYWWFALTATNEGYDGQQTSTTTTSNSNQQQQFKTTMNRSNKYG